MSNFYQVYYDIQNASLENKRRKISFYMNDNNPFLTPKYSYVNKKSFLLKKKWANDEDNEYNPNKARKRCKTTFDPPFSKKSKPQNLFNTSLISENNKNICIDANINMSTNTDTNMSKNTDTNTDTNMSKNTDTNMSTNTDTNMSTNTEDDDNLSTHSGLSSYSFRPDLIEESFFNDKTLPIIDIQQNSDSHEDLEYSDISDNET